METTPPTHHDRDHSEDANHAGVVDDPRVSTVPLDTDDGGAAEEAALEREAPVDEG